MRRSSHAEEVPQDEVAPVIPSSFTSDEVMCDLSGRVLIGKILTDRKLSWVAVQDAIWRMWEQYQLTQIAAAPGNILVFTFQTREQATRVMVRGSWCVLNQIMSLQSNRPDRPFSEVCFCLVPFWMQIHGLPLSLMTSDTLHALAKRVGPVLEVENPVVGGNLLRTFARVRLTVDTSKPIWAGSWVSLDNENNILSDRCNLKRERGDLNEIDEVEAELFKRKRQKKEEWYDDVGNLILVTYSNWFGDTTFVVDKEGKLRPPSP